MSKFTLFLSLGIILFIHFTALTFSYEKNKPVVSKPKYQKVSVQLAKLKKVVKPIEKPVEKLNVPKPIVKKEVFKKPIKKEAKREFVKKVAKKKPVKKRVPKKVVKKKVSKKPIKKEIKKPIEKPKVIEKVEKEVKKEIKKEEEKKVLISKEQAQFLEKSKKVKNTYLVQLRNAIEKNKKYPTVSRKLEEQGLVIVSFKILKSGLIENIKLLKSSGKKRLDKAAIKAVKKTKKYKPFPKEIKKSFIIIDDLPVNFVINK